MKHYKVLIRFGTASHATWLPLQAASAYKASLAAFEKCEDTGFVPQPATLREISPDEYQALEQSQQ